MLADQVDYVIGVDTHLDTHELGVVAAWNGGVVARSSQQANPRGYADAVRFAGEHAPGRRVWAIEGSGHYGAGLARFLACHAETVVEVTRTPRSGQRLQGKDDRLDAVRAARAALGSERLASPRTGQRREALRMLLLTRRSAVDVRRVGLVQLRSMLVTAPEDLREQLRELPLQQLLNRCSRLSGSRSGSPDKHAAVLVLRTLARRVQAATDESATLKREILALVRPSHPGPAGAGYVVVGAVNLLGSEALGDATNNEAEYTAVRNALRAAADAGATSAHVRMDSSVVLGQLTGASQARAKHLIQLKEEVEAQKARYAGRVTFARIPRERNGVADELAKDGARASKALNADRRP
jgi:transposase